MSSPLVNPESGQVCRGNVGVIGASGVADNRSCRVARAVGISVGHCRFPLHRVFEGNNIGVYDSSANAREWRRCIETNRVSGDVGVRHVYPLFFASPTTTGDNTPARIFGEAVSPVRLGESALPRTKPTPRCSYTTIFPLPRVKVLPEPLRGKYAEIEANPANRVFPLPEIGSFTEIVAVPDTEVIPDAVTGRAAAIVPEPEYPNEPVPVIGNVDEIVAPPLKLQELEPDIGIFAFAVPTLLVRKNPKPITVMTLGGTTTIVAVPTKPSVAVPTTGSVAEMVPVLDAVKAPVPETETTAGGVMLIVAVLPKDAVPVAVIGSEAEIVPVLVTDVLPVPEIGKFAEMVAELDTEADIAPDIEREVFSDAPTCAPPTCTPPIIATLYEVAL